MWNSRRADLAVLLMPNSVCRVAALAAIGSAIVALAACQTYQPMPLDGPRHMAEWEHRMPAVPLNGEPGAADASTGPRITLEQAERTALMFNPGLRRLRAEVGVASASAAEAGRLADPEFELGIASLLKGGAEPWTLGIGIGFSIPLSGRLGAEKDQAGARVSVTLAEAAEREQELLRELRAAWREMAATQAHEATIRDMVPRFETAAEVGRVMQEAGQMSAADAAVFGMELAGIRRELEELVGERREQELKVRSIMGLHPRLPLTLDTELSAPSNDSAAVSVVSDSHPSIIVRRAEYAHAEASLRLAIEKQYPDLTLTPGLEWDQGEPRGGVGLTIPIPIIDGNRREIAEARAARLAAQTAFEATLEELASELALALAVRNRAEVRVAGLARDIIPGIEEQLRVIGELEAIGRGDALLKVDALRRLMDSEKTKLDAMLQVAKASDDIEFLTKPRSIVLSDQESPSKESK